MMKLDLGILRRIERFLDDISKRASSDLEGLQRELSFGYEGWPPPLRAGIDLMILAMQPHTVLLPEELAAREPLTQAFNSLATRHLSEVAEFERELAAYKHQLDELMSSSVFFKLTTGEYGLYETANAYLGEAVRDRFQGAWPDISEAARCMAVGRYSAAVHHLMRVAELGLRAVATSVGAEVNRQSRSWETLLRDIREVREKKFRNQTWGDKERDLYAHLYHLAEGIRNKVRNPTAHFGLSYYTQEDANEAATAVRNFMSQLAGTMDEYGEPKAP